MKILLVHNYYKQRGGEDVSFESEANMLRRFGHTVQTYTRNNDDIDQSSKSKVAFQSMWNRQTYNEVSELLRKFPADIIHCTNLFPLISVSIYDVARNFNIPIVQSLRNYRQMCLNSLFYRNSQVCEQCSLSSFAWRGVMHKCYRGSRIGSLVVATSNAYHRLRGTWKKKVDRFFTPTRFARDKFIEFGIPSKKIGVKPNFLIQDPGIGSDNREFALFVGRLSPEKGLDTLLEVWSQLDIDLPLKVVGDGFLRSKVQLAAESNPLVSYEGELPHDKVTELIGDAKFLIMPSQWYETFGRTLMEAFSRGTPVIASQLGAMEELVDDEQNGLTFQAGNQQQLAAAVRRLFANEPLRERMGEAARKSFLEKYTLEENHRLIMKIYRDAIQAKQVKLTKNAQLDTESA